MRMTSKIFEAAGLVLSLAQADIQSIGNEEVYAGSTKAELEEGWAWLQQQLRRHRPKNNK